MVSPVRWALIPAVIVGWLVASGPAAAAVPEIKDDARFFSAETIRKANDIIRQVHDEDHKDLFIETNPLPVKAALATMGMIEEEYRLPLVPMNPRNRETLGQTLRSCGLLRR